MSTLTPQQLYEQFIEDTTKIGCALEWQDLPDHVKLAWEDVYHTCKAYFQDEEENI